MIQNHFCVKTLHDNDKGDLPDGLSKTIAALRSWLIDIKNRWNLLPTWKKLCVLGTIGLAIITTLALIGSVYSPFADFPISLGLKSILIGKEVSAAIALLGWVINILIILETLVLDLAHIMYGQSMMREWEAPMEFI